MKIWQFGAKMNDQPNTDCEVDYEERVVAFLDVLGFSELVNSSANDINLTQITKEIVDEMFEAASSWVHKEPLPATKMKLRKIGIKPPVDDARLQFTQFSDCLVLSTDQTNSGLLQVLEICLRISFSLLKKGYLVRGGIAAGLLYHKTNTVFGPAFLEAYKQDQSGTPPRIVMGPEIRRLANRVDLIPDQWSAIFRLDHHDLLDTVHTLLFFETYRESFSEDSWLTRKMVDDVRLRIQMRANDLESLPSIRAKWRYIMNYWNEVAEKNSAIGRIG